MSTTILKKIQPMIEHTFLYIPTTHPYYIRLYRICQYTICPFWATHFEHISYWLLL